MIFLYFAECRGQPAIFSFLPEQVFFFTLYFKQHRNKNQQTYNYVVLGEKQEP